MPTATEVENHDRYKPLTAEHPISIEQFDSPVTVSLGEQVIVDHGSAVALHESHHDEKTGTKHYPTTYYIAPESIDRSKLVKSETVTYCPFKGYANYYSYKDQKDIAWVYEQPYEQVRDIKGRLAFYPDKATIDV